MPGNEGGTARFITHSESRPLMQGTGFFVWEKRIGYRRKQPTNGTRRETLRTA